MESRIRGDHPLRDVKQHVDAILLGMSDLVDQAYPDFVQPGIPPEVLLKALLLQARSSIRSEKQLLERIDTDLLFRWFLDLGPADELIDGTADAHNRPRLGEHQIITVLFDAIVQQAISANHFSVDGKIIESYASTKSFQPKGDRVDQRNDSSDSERPSGSGRHSFKPRHPEVDFHGQKRSNETHASTTDPEALLFRKGKGKPAQLAHMGHAVSENRHGLIRGVAMTAANGYAETCAAIDMMDSFKQQHGRHPATGVATDAGI